MLKCPFCFSAKSARDLAAMEMHKGTRGMFHYACCEGCGSVYCVDCPLDLSAFYKDYYSFADVEPPSQQVWWKRSAIALYATFIVRLGIGKHLRGLYRNVTPRLMRFISPNLQAFLFIGADASDRIIDVGSGGGQFVRELRMFGYRNAVGIDPFLEPGLSGPLVRRADVESLSGTFDVIVLNHSFEHLSDPGTTLKKCAGLIAQTGTVVIHIPSVASEEFSRYGRHWWGLHAPYHTALPSSEGLSQMASRCGLKVSDAICTSRFDHYLYSEDYELGIADKDANSVRRSNCCHSGMITGRATARRKIARRMPFGNSSPIKVRFIDPIPFRIPC